MSCGARFYYRKNLCEGQDGEKNQIKIKMNNGW